MKKLVLLVACGLMFAGQAKISKVASLSNNDITLSIESNEDVYGVQFDINFNQNEVTLSKEDITSKVDGINLYSNVWNDEGRARVLMFSLSGQKILDTSYESLSDIVSIPFTAVDGFGGSSYVELVDVTLAGQGGKSIGVTTQSFEVGFTSPTQTKLNGNYPNPFNPSTTISYQIAEGMNVDLIVYDLKGAEVKTLVSSFQEDGNYTAVWDGRNNDNQQVSSGSYKVVFRAGNHSETLNMTLLK